MKTLIESSIKVKGIGPSGTKTIFNIEKPSETTDSNFVKLERMQNRNVSVSFKFEENGVEGEGTIKTVLVGTDEEIKQNTINLINQTLNGN
jgi:hypothetical protein